MRNIRHSPCNPHPEVRINSQTFVGGLVYTHPAPHSDGRGSVHVLAIWTPAGPKSWEDRSLPVLWLNVLSCIFKWSKLGSSPLSASCLSGTGSAANRLSAKLGSSVDEDCTQISRQQCQTYPLIPTYQPDSAAPAVHRPSSMLTGPAIRSCPHINVNLVIGTNLVLNLRR